MIQVDTHRACASCGELLPIESFQKTKDFSEYRRKVCTSCYTLGKTLKEFGLSLDEYNQMLESQKNVCAICGCAETRTRYGKALRLCIDHDNQTGKVRGLLCSNCNVAIGLLQHDPALISEALSYLEKSLTDTEGTQSVKV